jgi:hypothetical protein
MTLTPDLANGTKAKDVSVEGMRILVLGYTRFALRQTAMFDARGARATYVKRNFALRALPLVPMCDIVYQVGGPIVPRSVFDACRFFGKPIVKHWLGSDTMRLHDPNVQRQSAADFVTNWADAPWLVDELKAAGIEGQTVGLSPIAVNADLPFPSTPLRVLWFLPEDRFEFYGGQMALAVAREMPELKFVFVGSERRGRPAPPNVQYVGFLDEIDDAYAQTHVLVRMADHDGLSQMVLEALNHARYVIWNYPFEGTLKAANESEVIAHLKKLAARMADGGLGYNEAGRISVRSGYLGDIIADHICEGISAVAKRRHNGVALS